MSRPTPSKMASEKSPVTNQQWEPGSFRDREGRVFYHADAVFRGLSQRALAEWETLSGTTFFQRLMAEGKLVYTERIDPNSLLEAPCAREWAAILQHRRIPFISYPYEWSFGMLKHAALLQLDLILTALSERMILKDATPFNFQWIGTNPIFIDIPSFEKLVPGEPWIGYRQFCQMFLYPLLLQSYKNIPFHSWLRGSIDGITPEHCRNLMSARDLLRPSVLMHVTLQAKAQARNASTTRNVKNDLRVAGFSQALIETNIRRLKKLLRRLTWKHPQSNWLEYDKTNTYTDADREKKISFVRDVVRSRSWNLVWDIGCNTGTFSRIAAENARYVVAMDADHVTIDRLYQDLQREHQNIILPLVSNITDPSPSLGWRGLERKALTERGNPDLTLCLALIHHVVISANVPLREFITWLADLGTNVIIEFITKADPMVQTLLRNKRDNYADYETDYFESCLAEAFHIVRREELTSKTRILYYAQTTR